MAGDDHVIENDVVRIAPDLSGFRTDLDKQLVKAMKPQPVAAVKLIADRSGLGESIKAKVAEQQALSRQPTYKIKLEADASNFLSSVRKELRKATLAGNSPTYKVKLEADGKGGASRAGARGGSRGGGGSSESAEERAAEKAANLIYKRVRDNLEKVEQAEDQAFSTRFRRARSFEENVAGLELAAYREQARRKKVADDAEKAEADQKAAALVKAAEREATGVKAVAERAARDQKQIAERGARDGERIAERAARDAEAANKRRNKTLFSQNQLIDFGGKGIKPLNLLYAGLVALTPALFSVASNAVQASTSLLALGSAGIGAALGVGALVAAFGGLGDALTLRKQVQKEATAEAANQTDALSDLAGARRAYANAQRDEITANQNVHTSRLEAIRDLQNLRQSVKDLNNEFADDALTLEEKKVNESRTLNNFFATSLEKRRATQDRKNAETELSDTGLQRKQKTDDLKTSVSKGIEKSDKVLAAKEGSRDARDRTLDAADALKKQTRAATGVNKTSSAAADLAQKLREMSPAGRDMYYWFDRNEGVLKRLRQEIQGKTLPGFNHFLDVIYPKKRRRKGTSLLEIAAQYMGEIGSIIGKYAGKLGDFFDSPLFRTSMATIQKNNTTAFEKFGDAIIKFADPLTRIFAAASPGIVSLADGIDELATKFKTFITNADKDGSLAKYFQDARIAAGKWYAIVKNIVGIIGDLFGASLPAGGSLVDQFLAFTENLKNLTGSTEGQKNIKEFFDKVAGLPFAKIGDFFVQASAFFVTFRTVRFLKELNPFFLALGAFAASHPETAASAFKVIGDVLATVVKIIADNPAAATGLLGILAAAKVAKTIGFDIKIPAVTGIRDLLTSKFKVLEKFTGGGASTATMTVNAGVVNIYGGKGINAPGSPSSPVTPGVDSKGNPKATPGKPTKGGRFSTAAGGIGSGNILIAAAAIGYQIGGDEVSRVTEILNGDAKEGYHGFADAITKKPFDWSNWYKTFLDNSAIVAIPLLAKKIFGDEQKKPVPTSSVKMGIESIAYNRLENNLQSFGKDSDVTRTSLMNYITARKDTVTTKVDEVRKRDGPIAAAKVQREEDKKSADGLAKLLDQYGYTKQAAKVYADQVYGVTTQTEASRKKNVEASVSFDSMGNALETTTTKAALLKQGADKLAGTINGLVGDHVIEFSTKNYDAVKKQLDLLYATQHVLYNPTYSNSAAGADTISSQNQFLDPKTGLPKKYGRDKYATGGQVIGAGTATSDSIAARLSNGEYVMPTKTVQHYGVGVMDAMRNRQIPGYAAGGPVGNIPMTVNLPTKGFQLPTPNSDAYVPVSQGVATGNVDVAETAEATARAMGASTKQMISVIAAGLVESGLRNLNYGDRDSVGYLQQRPSQGWGSRNQLQNVAYATRKYINAARRYDSPNVSAGELAARVQRPAAQYRGRYAEREADAIAVLNRMAPFVNATAGPSTGGLGAAPMPSTWQGLWQIIKGNFPGASKYSDFRPGARTKYGNNLSRHALGKAIDVSPWKSIASFIHNRYGAKTYELISPFSELDLYRGKPHAYSRNVQIQHGAYGDPTHNAHVHWSTYDSGGVLPPGFTMAYNGTGKNETIRTYEQEKQVQGALGGGRIDPRDLAALASMMGGGTTPQITMDGRRVAETTNRYNYLPAGV